MLADRAEEKKTLTDLQDKNFNNMKEMMQTFNPAGMAFNMMGGNMMGGQQMQMQQPSAGQLTWNGASAAPSQLLPSGFQGYHGSNSNSA